MLNMLNLYKISRGRSDRSISFIIGLSVYAAIAAMIVPPIMIGLLFGGAADSGTPKFIGMATSMLERVIPDFALSHITDGDTRETVARDEFIILSIYWMYVVSAISSVAICTINMTIARKFKATESEYSKFIFGRKNAAIGVAANIAYCAYAYSGLPVRAAIINSEKSFGSHGFLLDIFMIFFGVVFFSLFSSLAVSKEIFRD